MNLTKNQQEAVDCFVKSLQEFNQSRVPQPLSLIDFKKLNSELNATQERIAILSAQNEAVRKASKDACSRDFKTIECDVEKIGLNTTLGVGNTTIYIHRDTCPHYHRDTINISVQYDTELFRGNYYKKGWCYECSINGFVQIRAKDINTLLSKPDFIFRLQELYLKSKGL